MLSRSRMLNGAALSSVGILAGGSVGATVLAMRTVSSADGLSRVFSGAFIVCITSSLRYVVHYLDPANRAHFLEQSRDFLSGQTARLHPSP